MRRMRRGGLGPGRRYEAVVAGRQRRIPPPTQKYAGQQAEADQQAQMDRWPQQQAYQRSSVEAMQHSKPRRRPLLRRRPRPPDPT